MIEQARVAIEGMPFPIPDQDTMYNSWNPDSYNNGAETHGRRLFVFSSSCRPRSTISSRPRDLNLVMLLITIKKRFHLAALPLINDIYLVGGLALSFKLRINFSLACLSATTVYNVTTCRTLSVHT